MSAPTSGAHPDHPRHPVLEAVRSGDFERASLRLLYGLLVAIEETAPPAREELLHLMVERRLPSHRAPFHDSASERRHR